MSIERELGAINEAIAGLKKGQDDFREDLKATTSALAASVNAVDKKLDSHLTNYANFNFKVGKIAGTVGIAVSLIFAMVKEAVASMTHK